MQSVTNSKESSVNSVKADFYLFICSEREVLFTMLSYRPDCKMYLESTVGDAWRMEDLQPEVSESVCISCFVSSAFIIP